jgi:hypothetical protein
VAPESTHERVMASGSSYLINPVLRFVGFMV